MGCRKVQDLIDALGITPDKDGFERLAADLSALAGKSPGWTWRYVRSIYKGDYPESKKMRKAITAKLAETDGASGLLSASVPVTVYVSPDKANAVAGALIMESAKVCPSCSMRFVGNVPHRIFCPECRPSRKCRKVQIV